MGFMTIFSYTLRQNWRDRATYLEMMLLPLLLIFILGMSLRPVFQTPLISPTQVAYFNENQGQLGENFQQFLLIEDVASLLDMQEVTSIAEGMELVETGEVHAFVHVPNLLHRSEEGAIRLTGSPHHSLRISILEIVLKTFTNGANTVMAMERMGETEPVYQFQQNSIEQRSLSSREILPGAMDYYAVTMLVMFMMYGTTYAVFGMKHNYLGATGRRILTTPIRHWEHYFGLVLANVVTVLLQGLIIVSVTGFAFGVHWGNNLPLLFGILFMTGILAIGLGTAIVMVTREEILAGNIVNILVPVMTFTAGGFFRINVATGSFFSYLQHLSPNYLAQTALFNTIYGGDLNRTLAMMAAMGAFIVVTFAVALLSERRVRA